MTLSTLTPAAPPLAPPFEVETDPHRQAALDWVNHVRDLLGFDPLHDLRPCEPGVLSELARHCPVAVSISEGDVQAAQAHASTMVWSAGEKVFSGCSPNGVVEFVRRFDRGAYPDLQVGAS